MRAPAPGGVKTAATLGISRGRAYRLMERIDALDLDRLRGEASGRVRS